MINPELENQINVTVIATGFRETTTSVNSMKPGITSSDVDFRNDKIVNQAPITEQVRPQTQAAP